MNSSDLYHYMKPTKNQEDTPDGTTSYVIVKESN